MLVVSWRKKKSHQPTRVSEDLVLQEFLSATILSPFHHHPLRLTYIPAAMEKACLCLSNHHHSSCVQLHGKLDEETIPEQN